MSADKPIGVFDSGIGGLSIVRAIRECLPGEDLLYVADTAYAPYGTRRVDEIRERSVFVARYLVARGCKAIVVACNTATAAAVDALRASLAVPVVAMEPALKPAAARTRSDVIGVLATASTLASPRYAALRDRHGHRVQVLERVCHSWVQRVEHGAISGREARAAVASEVEPLVRAGADVLVLGCTHFPYLAPLIEEIAGPEVAVLDPSPAVAAQLARRLDEHDLQRSASAGTLTLLATDLSRVRPAAARQMIGPMGRWHDLRG